MLGSPGQGSGIIYLCVYVLICIVFYIHTRVCAHTMEYLSAIVRNEILPFPAAWMALEVIVLNEIRQRKTNTM